MARGGDGCTCRRELTLIKASVMTKVFSLLEFAAHLQAVARDEIASRPKIVEEACKIKRMSLRGASVAIQGSTLRLLI